MTARDLRRLFLTVTVSLACGKPVASVPAQREVSFAGTAAVRVSPARSGEWAAAVRDASTAIAGDLTDPECWLLGAGPEIVRTYGAPEGWILIDAVAHPSGEVSLLSLRVDSTADYPLRTMISRIGTGGAVADLELLRLPPRAAPNPLRPSWPRSIARGSSHTGRTSSRSSAGRTIPCRLTGSHSMDGLSIRGGRHGWSRRHLCCFSGSSAEASTISTRETAPSSFMPTWTGEENLYVGVASTAGRAPQP